MLFLESHARLLLLLHAVLGAATVAVTTHLFLWSRRWVRGARPGAAVRWFAVTALLLYGSQFALGNLLYPVYRVRVRAAYLEMPSAISADVEARRHARETIRARAGVAGRAAAPPFPPGARLARLFDVKEHWVAIGLPLLIAALLLIFTWDPARDPSRAVRGLLLGATAGAAATAWLAALVGLTLTAVRALP